MMKNSSKLLFLFTLITGTLMTISANSWLGAWMGLEINLLSFIPLMNNMNNLKSSEASLKYFLTQAMASSILLFAVILFMMKSNMIFQNEININNYYKMIILSSLLLKSGTAPFHFWFPEVMEGLTWNNCLILMTWQKFAPLMLMYYLMIYKMIIFIIMITVSVGSLGGLNQTSLRKIFAFSSINHLGWMLSGMLINEYTWMIYFLFYSFISMNIIFILNILKIYHFNQLFSMFMSNKYLKILTSLNILSLGGLPPFLGFIPKWMIIQLLSIENQMMLILWIMLMTLITLFFYLRLCFSALMLNYPENNWILYNMMNNFNLKFYLILSFFSTMGLPIISIIYYMF
uniref:NADH-ubiquinone oxidoreductase chain 2 n=1 Tax=Asyndetus clavipes TaxID=2779313 RepID=A0A7S6NI96_9MUSC|nr:NADH dehydrogenase subunit 2 [Asyndetus clavipes]QOL12437.1 NADH dehydrogenase subunit 2 [Asyndetus clavipes]